MRATTIRNITTFLLVLLSTILIVLVLSFFSRVSSHAVEKKAFTAEVTSPTGVSANIKQDEGVNLSLVLTYAAVITVPVTFVMVRLGKRNKKSKRSYKTVAAYDNSEIVYNKKYITKKYRVL